MQRCRPNGRQHPESRTTSGCRTIPTPVGAGKEQFGSFPFGHLGETAGRMNRDVLKLIQRKDIRQALAYAAWLADESVHALELTVV